MLIVQKFGGTSVADVQKIKSAVKIVEREYRKNNKVVVVVSAMAGITNKLVSYFLNLVSNNEDPVYFEEYDSLISVGENITAPLFAMALQEIGIKSKSLCSFQVPVITDSLHTCAKIQKIDSQKIENLISNSIVPIISGFQGNSIENQITTIGRGGSDTSAVAIAVGLNADLCEIYTDVKGVYTADPRLVSNPHLINEISYLHMLNMTKLGSQILHPRANELAARYKVNLHIKSTFDNNQGTILTENLNIMERPHITGIAANTNVALCRVVFTNGIDTKILQQLQEFSILSYYSVQSSTFEGCLDMNYIINFNTKFKECNGISFNIDIDANLVSVVGHSIDYTVFDKSYEALSKAKIPIISIFQSINNISFFIQQKYLDQSVKQLHGAFFKNS